MNPQYCKTLVPDHALHPMKNESNTKRATARPIYFKRVVEFTTKKGVTNYSVKVWNEDGTNPSVYESGILTDKESPREIAERV